MASQSRRLRRSIAAGPAASGARVRVAWLGVLARQARIPNELLVAMIQQHPLPEVKRQLKARIARLRAKAAARDEIRSDWVPVEGGPLGLDVKISRVPRKDPTP